MDSKATKEKEEKIEEYRKLLDVAYKIFEGKYSPTYLGEIPYKDLLLLMDRERSRLESMSKEEKEAEAGSKMMTQLSNGFRL